MTPDLGQGACQAIVDATTIARYLTETPDVSSALRLYERRRVRNAVLTSMLARTFGTLGQWQSRFGCAVRDAALQATPLPIQLRPLDLVVGRSDPRWRPGVSGPFKPGFEDSA
jgi:2-polyprenyl-6-methoxyphenol hydroxylase-like FAD-dependent oxidoreductase